MSSMDCWHLRLVEKLDVSAFFARSTCGAQNIPWLAFLFGSGKGSGAAVMMFVTGLSGAIVCILFGQILKKYQFQES